MYSVTQRISMVKQPYGGCINRKQFNVIQLDDGITLNENENISANLIGLAVDYMTRFMMDKDRPDAFQISLMGAILLDHITSNTKNSAQENAIDLLSRINGLNKESIISACKLTGYDVCLRAGILRFKPVEEINPDADTIENIITMVNRSISFWKEYGPIIKDGFTFEGGYTDTISSGDGDYLTKDTLWDFKVSKKEINSKQTLQLLVYYIMGTHSIHEEFKNIKNLGIFNPRMNKVYLLDVNTIPQALIDKVSSVVIGY